MEFAPQQDRALTAVSDWLRRKDRPIFRLFGYAGTGKTTLAKHFAADIDGPVFFLAPTGKAAYVLRQKGCPNSGTIHQAIYTPKDKSQARLKELQAALVAERTKQEPSKRRIDELKNLIDVEQANLKRPSFSLNTASALRGAKLIVVDESSMVDEYVGQDLESFGVPILALGDPAQLPPVKGAGYFTNVGPDFLLTDIHRQARDNPIIEMSRIVREGGALSLGRYGSSEVVSMSSFQREWVFQADQILVGRNETRKNYNRRIRELQQRAGALPEVGDKLVCLRNNHEAGLLNGSLWDVKGVHDTQDDQVYLQLGGDDQQDVVTSAHACYFHGKEPEWWERKEADEFDYGYALTVHKSQGSQFDNVLLIDEWQRADRRQWLYTAITRAAQSVRVVR